MARGDRLAVARQLIADCDFDGAAHTLAGLLAIGGVDAADNAAIDVLSMLCGLVADHQRMGDALTLVVARHRAADEVLRTAIGARMSSLGDDEPCAPTFRPSRHEPPPEVGRVGRRRPGVGAPGKDAAGLHRAHGSARPVVAVGVLGSLDVRIDGRRIARWGSLKARGVFEYLVLHGGGPVRRDVLLELFWPGYTHSSARNNLNVSLHGLRRTLQAQRVADYVCYSEGCYLLDPEVAWWIDRDAFLGGLERAGAAAAAGDGSDALVAYYAALELYRGPLLEDDTAAEWHLDEQRHLSELRLRALESVAEIELSDGVPGRAAQAAQTALADDPCRESAHRLLMRCYSAERQHHLVVRQLRICTAALGQHLGTSPAPETVELCRRLTRRADADPN